MTGFRNSILALLLVPFAACATVDVATDATAHNVLFVGNSFTYYNNSLHKHYRALLRSASPGAATRGRARAMTISGGQLPEHAAALPAMLASEDWDVVVLQGHSLGPIEDASADAFRQAARDYARLIRARGAEPVFFMTWAYTAKPEMSALLDAAYTGIGQELGARVVPVGLAFARVTDERPAIALRTADARHPTLAGTYLAACTFYSVLRGESPEGLGYTAGLDSETSAYLQRVAWQTAVAYARRREQAG